MVHSDTKINTGYLENYFSSEKINPQVALEMENMERHFKHGHISTT